MDLPPMKSITCLTVASSGSTETTHWRLKYSLGGFVPSAAHRLGAASDLARAVRRYVVCPCRWIRENPTRDSSLQAHSKAVHSTDHAIDASLTDSPAERPRGNPNHRHNVALR